MSDSFTGSAGVCAMPDLAEKIPARTPGVAALLAPWAGPFGGVPPFGQFQTSDLDPALEIAMAETLADIERIAADPAAPTFENTLAAKEQAGRSLERVMAVFGVYTSTLAVPEVQATERVMAPKLAALNDQIIQNSRLFARIESVYERRDVSSLSSEQKRLAWLEYTTFAREGAKLDEPSKKKLSELNQRLATLNTQFSQNLLAEEDSQSVVLDHEADLEGLPPALRDSASAAAASRGQSGKWAVLNTRSSVEPFLTYSARRDLREKVWRMFTMRGDNGNGHDNNTLIPEILRLRAQRAKLLGYATHAHWRLEDSMAKTPERALELLEAVWKPAVARVREEVADMQAIADGEKAGIRISPWDYRFYAEKVRKAKYDLDHNEVKPYLQLENLREGMFYVAGELFGLRFVPVPEGSIPLCHPDVRVWEVADAQGKHVGLWYFDPYARPGKSSGAWMNEYRRQARIDGDVTAIVSNNANFVKGKPILISWDDAKTLFHEFGHALHGLVSRVTYPSLSGTAVCRDFVEFPSQLLERWLSARAVLDRFALHVETGKPMPAELVRKIERSETFNQGFATVEYLASALVDMKLHLAGERPIDPRAFEQETLTALQMPAEMVMRHRPPHFGHIFSGDAYSAAYYSYLWSDTLSADAWEAFTEAGGPFVQAVAKRLRDHVFSVGNTVDPAEAYRAFRGRDPGTDALMRHRGFPIARSVKDAKSDG